MQIREVSDAHAVAQRDSVTTPLLHRGGQIVKMTSDDVRLIIRKFTLVGLTRKKTDRLSADADNPGKEG